MHLSAMERVSISNCVQINDEQIKDFNKEFFSSSKLTENKEIENVPIALDEKHQESIIEKEGLL